MRAVQASLRELPAAIPEPMSWLVVLPLCAKVIGFVDYTIAALLPHMDLHVHHYDAQSEQDENYLVYTRLQWYLEALAHPSLRYRGFREPGGTGCKLELWRTSMRLVLESHTSADGGGGGYTHLWLLDPDLEFRFFSVPTFMALVAHSAPLLSQPAILPWAKGMRATDFASLKAQIHFAKKEPKGRERVNKHVHGAGSQQIEVMAMLLDARLVGAFYHGTLAYDARGDRLQQWAINRLAYVVSKKLNDGASMRGPSPCVATNESRYRPAGMVYDWTPLIHREVIQLTAANKYVARKGAQAGATNAVCIRGAGDNATKRDAAFASNVDALLWRGETECPWTWFRVGAVHGRA